MSGNWLGLIERLFPFHRYNCCNYYIKGKSIFRRTLLFHVSRSLLNKIMHLSGTLWNNIKVHSPASCQNWLQQLPRSSIEQWLNFQTRLSFWCTANTRTATIAPRFYKYNRNWTVKCFFSCELDLLGGVNYFVQNIFLWGDK